VIFLEASAANPALLFSPREYVANGLPFFFLVSCGHIALAFPSWFDPRTGVPLFLFFRPGTKDEGAFLILLFFPPGWSIGASFFFFPFRRRISPFFEGRLSVRRLFPFLADRPRCAVVFSFLSFSWCFIRSRARSRFFCRRRDRGGTRYPTSSFLLRPMPRRCTRVSFFL